MRHISLGAFVTLETPTIAQLYYIMIHEHDLLQRRSRKLSIPFEVDERINVMTLR